MGEQGKVEFGVCLGLPFAADTNDRVGWVQANLGAAKHDEPGEAFPGGRSEPVGDRADRAESGRGAVEYLGLVQEDGDCPTVSTGSKEHRSGASVARFVAKCLDERKTSQPENG